MANEQETKKKPPAHEVIVTLLRQFARKHSRAKRAINGLGSSAIEKACLIASASEPIECQVYALITVLMHMHIPENARQWVVDALHRLPPNFLPPMIADLYAEIEGDKGGA